jgi:hypothetical protein
MAALEIIVDVRDSQTMSQYKTPKTGKIKFTNAVPPDKPPDGTEPMLEITAKKDHPWPFCKKGNADPMDQPILVPAGDSKAAWICNSVAGSEVLYTAKIGTATSEDPIIIFEPHKLKMDFTTGVIVGVVVGAIVAAIVLRSRTRQRPTQA